MYQTTQDHHGGTEALRKEAANTNAVAASQNEQYDIKRGLFTPGLVIAVLQAVNDQINPIDRGLQPLMTRQEVADYLRVSLRFVDGLIAEGKLKPVRIGRLCRFHKDDIAAFVQIAEGGERLGGAS